MVTVKSELFIPMLNSGYFASFYLRANFTLAEVL